mmetsp:Transcript_122516/g.261431  ORF Transcript_122516/g.261431 Transcript_122516/m.261431 type:complete len:207 (-) Transcript_122516:59-679(-)
MTLQMDQMGGYTPTDWLKIQRTEFDKENTSRILAIYGGGGVHFEESTTPKDEWCAPPSILRKPENGNLMGISKGWRSLRDFRPAGPEQPQPSLLPACKGAVVPPRSRTPSAASSVRDGGRTPEKISAGVASVDCARPVWMSYHLNQKAPLRPVGQALLQTPPATPSMHRTGSAPTLSLSFSPGDTSPKRLPTPVFAGCRRTCSGII